MGSRGGAGSTCRSSRALGWSTRWLMMGAEPAESMVDGGDLGMAGNLGEPFLSIAPSLLAMMPTLHSSELGEDKIVDEEPLLTP